MKWLIFDPYMRKLKKFSLENVKGWHSSIIDPGTAPVDVPICAQPTMALLAAKAQSILSSTKPSRWTLGMTSCATKTPRVRGIF